MFSTLRSKIIFFLTLIMLVTASAIMFFTYQDVGDAMRKAEKTSAQNVLNLVELNIEEEYHKLRADKVETIRQRREQLRSTAGISATVIGQYEKLLGQGTLSKEQLRTQIMDWFKSVSFSRGIDAFVLDYDANILAHTDQKAAGTSIANLTDIKSRKIAQVMRASKLKPRGDYAVFHWDTPGKQATGKKMGYFLPLPQFLWTIGAVVSITDIEAEARRKLDKIIDSLSETFADIQIAQTGCAIVFDGQRKVLVPPCGRKIKGVEQPVLPDGVPLDRIMEAARSESGSVRFSFVPGDMKSEVPVKGEIQVYASYFKALDWYIAVYLPVEEIQLPARSLITRQISIIALIFFGSLVISFLLVTRISRPLDMLTRHAKEIPNYDFTKEHRDTAPIDLLPAKYNDEVGRLAESFIFMEAQLSKNIRELMETTASKERILSELNVARSIQLGILPKVFPPFPECNAFDLYAVLEPAKSVGGDLYDYFFVDDDHLCFTIGDVSDKGVPAALFMMITRTLIKTLSTRGMDPAKVMEQINNILSVDNPNVMFVTLIIGVLDIRTGQVRYANGGHNPPIVLDKEQPPSYREGLSGSAVGAMEDLPFTDLELTLQPGDALFLYTDGVTEAMDEKNNLFSDERLLEEVGLRSGQPVGAVINGVMREVSAHAASAGIQSDDITMLIIRYNGPSADPVSTSV